MKFDPNNLIQARFQRPVQGFSTTRHGGVSLPPFDQFNLGSSCGDDPAALTENRRRLRALLPASPRWLAQVHGRRVIHLDDWYPGIEADGAWSDRPGQVACVLTADCLPILLADRQARCVAAVHAGWRGLAAGVVEATIAALPTDPAALQAWIGPRIGPEQYQVGPEFIDHFPNYPECFRACGNKANGVARLHADLIGIARGCLEAAGVSDIEDCGLCTASDLHRFFSHRRDQRTGRTASLIFVLPSP